VAVHERGHRDDGELSQSNELDDIERVELFDRVQHGCNFGLDLAPESLPDLSDQVARLLPAAALCDVTEVCATSTLAPVEETAGEAPADPELPELFREFLTGSVTTGAQALLAQADLIEAIPALDLGGWDRIGQDVVTGARGGLSDHLAGDRNALAGFTGDADDEIFAGHVSKPPPDDGRHEARHARPG